MMAIVWRIESLARSSGGRWTRRGATELVTQSGVGAHSTRAAPAARRGVPCYCTNPDRHKLAKSGGIAPGAGSIALAYEELGGPVRWFGKPYPAVYRQARALLKTVPAERIVCIGDSLEHDIAGAAGAGLSSCLVRTGILADTADSGLASIADSYDVRPDFLMERFGL